MKKRKVRIEISIAGSHRGKEFGYKPGDTPTLEKELADAWLESGVASEVKDDPDSLRDQIAELQKQLKEVEKK